jgi:alcohol dehydrogenase class IV
VPLEAAVSGLVTRLGLPARLRETSLAEGDLAAVAAHALEEAHRGSPRPIESTETLEALLRTLW